MPPNRPEKSPSHRFASESSHRLAFLSLALVAFVVGTSEFAVVGILGPIADGLGAGLGTAGLLVTGYALGISLGGPALTALTLRLPRRTLLLGALAAYVAASAGAAAAGGIGVLLAARCAAGLAHGVIVGAATSVAVALAGPGRQGRAISLVFGGISVATVLGVPLGTLVGQSLGWRAALAAVAGLGALALLAVRRTVPPTAAMGAAGLAGQARGALSRPVLALLGTAVVLFTGQFTAYTYLAGYLTEVTGVDGRLVGGYLLAFGTAAAVGTFVGGRCADRRAAATLTAGCAGLTIALPALHLCGRSGAAAAVLVAGWGLVGFGLVPALQSRIVELAGPGGDFAATLGVSAANAGIAAGAALGGWTVSAHGVSTVVPLGAAICLGALLAVAACARLRPATPPAPPPLAQHTLPHALPLDRERTVRA
ncbi:MFS transporter [Kitasatospora sp. NPDC097605]|uniref:MFS transporter n=1 Tax=Kitasatospora sp. NPDC097605 TaxID=3157226 RepID=UPI00331BCACD